MIRIVCIGKIKNEWKNANNELFKRINSFTKFEIIELKEEKAKELEKYIKGYCVVLDEKGTQLTSKEFSNLIKEKNKITFFIGGKAGFEEKFLQKADFVLSLSKMTFSHQLARIILLEQIYRAFCIIHNLPYSK